MSRNTHLRTVTAFRGKKADLRSYGEAKLLVNWLNLKGFHSLTEHQKQTCRFVELLKGVGTTPVPPGAVDREIRGLLRSINHLPWVLRPRMRPKAEFGAVSSSCTGWYADQYWPTELQGLVLAARLSAHGLDLVRQCTCGKWLVGWNRRNRFCSAKCKRAFESDQRKTPQAREKRRQYMRDYRKNPIVKKKRRVRR